jgi:hypothetical protein
MRKLGMGWAMSWVAGGAMLLGLAACEEKPTTQVVTAAPPPAAASQAGRRLPTVQRSHDTIRRYLEAASPGIGRETRFRNVRVVRTREGSDALCGQVSLVGPDGAPGPYVPFFSIIMPAGDRLNAASMVAGRGAAAPYIRAQCG